MLSIENKDYINTSYKLRQIHIWVGIMNDWIQNPICLAFKEALGDNLFFSCGPEYLIIAQNENDYQDGIFIEFRLSYNMRDFLRKYNTDQDVDPMIMCVSEIPGTDEVLLHMFEENWRHVYEYAGRSGYQLQQSE